MENVSSGGDGYTVGYSLEILSDFAIGISLTSFENRLLGFSCGWIPDCLFQKSPGTIDFRDELPFPVERRAMGSREPNFF